MTGLFHFEDEVPQNGRLESLAQRDRQSYRQRACYHVRCVLRFLLILDPCDELYKEKRAYKVVYHEQDSDCHELGELPSIDI